VPRVFSEVLTERDSIQTWAAGNGEIEGGPFAACIASLNVHNQLATWLKSRWLGMYIWLLPGASGVALELGAETEYKWI
jgi:hypothetical protein